MANNKMKEYVLKKVNRRIEGYKNEPELIRSEYKREKELGKSYKGREILELIQNAEDELSDELPKEIAITFDGEVLSISNYGDPFDEYGVTALMYSNSSDKEQRKRKVIGNKGTGFRSILGWADKITIHSADLHICFSEEYAQMMLHKYVLSDIDSSQRLKSATLTFPEWIDETDKSNFTTVITLQIKNDYRVINDIREQLLGLKEDILLFLNKTQRLQITIDGKTIVFEKALMDSESVLLRRLDDGIETAKKVWFLNKKEGRIDDEYYSIILAYDGSSQLPASPYIYSYFKTDVEFPFPVLFHANFKLNPDRNHLIKNDECNEMILEEAAELLVDTAMKIYSKRVSFDRIGFLLPQKALCVELNKYGFYEKLVDKIKSAPVFPTVNQKYVEYSENLKYYESGLGKYLSGRDFSDLLMSSDDSRINGFLATLEFDKYEYDVIANRVDRWVKTRKVTDENIRNIAYTAIAYINEFDWELKSYRSFRPSFFFNADRKLIANGKTIFLSEAEVSFSKPPTFVHVEFLDPYMRNYLNKRLKDEMYSDKEAIIEKLKVYNIKEYNSLELVEYINSVLSNKNKGQVKERWITLIKWLWGNRASFSEIDKTYDMFFLSRSGKLKRSKTLYYGVEYDNSLGEELLGSLPEDVMICDLREIVGCYSLDELLSFLKMFGIAELPRRVDLRESYAYGYGKKVGEFERLVFSHLKYPLILDNVVEFENIDDFCSRLSHAYIEHSDFDKLETILTRCSTATIIKWVINDNRLQNLVYSRFETSMKKVEVIWDSNRTERPLNTLKQPFSYVYYMFCKIPWIQVGNKKYCIDDCLLGFDFANDEMSRYLVEPDITAYASDFDAPKGKVRKEIQTVLERLSIKKNFADLPLYKMYEVLNHLPEIEGVEAVAKRFYNSIVDKTDYDYSDDDFECEEYKQYLQQGQILTNNGFKPVKDSFYLDGKDVCEKVAKTYNLICVPKKRSKARIKTMFGIDQLKLDGSIQDSPSLHRYNNEFAANLQQFVVVAFACRIGTVADIKDEARQFSNIKIQICDRIQACYKTSKDDDTRLVELDDYEYILDGTSNYYLKVPSELSYSELAHNSDLSFAIANIFSSYLDVSEIIPRFTHLYYVWDYDERELVIRQELEDESVLMQAKELLSFSEDIREEFADIITRLTDNDISVYESYVEKIDFDNFTSIYNASVIIELFDRAGINVSDYNSETPSSPIDLRAFYQKEVERLKPYYKQKYMSTWYCRLREAPLSEKKKLVENFLLFDYSVIRLENDVYFSVEKEIVRQLEINDTVEIIDFPSLYERNFSEWVNTVSNCDYVNDFVRSTEVMSMVYFQEYVELNRLYSAYLLSVAPAKEEDKESDCREITPVLLYATTKPWIPSKSNKSSNHNTKTTGYTPPKKNEKELERIGCDGEEIVYHKLLSDDRFNMVSWVSENAKKKKVNPEGRAGCGYDIEYYDEKGRRKYVDVKSTKKGKLDEITFYMSDFEYEFGKTHAEDYQIFFVLDTTSDNPRVLVFEDLFVNNSFNKKKFAVDIAKEYTITATAII